MPRAQQLHLDARQQLARRERLDQVVVGAGLQPLERASSPARADSIMTGMSRVASSARSARSSPKPSSSGIITSVSTRSGARPRDGLQRLARRCATASTCQRLPSSRAT